MNQVGKAVLWLAVCSTLLAGCGAPLIPNAVSGREYEVYSAWTNHYFEKKAPKALFLYSRTFVLDPLADGGGDSLHRQDAIPWDMMQRLHDLGTAEYQLDFDDFRQPNSLIGLKHKVIATPPMDQVGYDALSFSRVAFNRAGDKALFGFNDACATGECGVGGLVLASKVSGVWHFQRTHRIWMS